MRLDLHNHTTRCNHASGTMEEYIQCAIQQGIDVYGFSDHAPMRFDPKYRMRVDQQQDYENEIERLQRTYENEIEILLGYEVDYLPGFIDPQVLERPVDYFIGSVHFINEWGFDNPEFIGGYRNKDIDQIWIDYFDAIEALAKSGQFDIVGHIDLIKVFNFLPKKEIKLIVSDALHAIKTSNMVLELNPAGWRKPVKEQYPSREILEMAYELDIPITFGSDAHHCKHIGFGYEKLVHLAREVGYTHCVTFKKRDKIEVMF